jgi:ubiquitin-protein ligase
MWSPVQTVGSLLVSVQSLLTGNYFYNKNVHGCSVRSARSHVRAQLPPVLGVGTVIIVFSNIKLLLLCCLLCLCTDPNPDSPANPDAAKLFCTNMKEYKKRVRQVAERSLETSF